MFAVYGFCCSTLSSKADTHSTLCVWDFSTLKRQKSFSCKTKNVLVGGKDICHENVFLCAHNIMTYSLYQFFAIFFTHFRHNPPEIFYRFVSLQSRMIYTQAQHLSRPHFNVMKYTLSFVVAWRTLRIQRGTRTYFLLLPPASLVTSLFSCEASCWEFLIKENFSKNLQSFEYTFILISHFRVKLWYYIYLAVFVFPTESEFLIMTDNTTEKNWICIHLLIKYLSSSYRQFPDQYRISQIISIFQLSLPSSVCLKHEVGHRSSMINEQKSESDCDVMWVNFSYSWLILKIYKFSISANSLIWISNLFCARMHVSEAIAVLVGQPTRASGWTNIFLFFCPLFLFTG